MEPTIDEQPTDPLYDPSIIPTLYGKIGALQVRNDVLSMQNAELRAEVNRLRQLSDTSNGA